MEVRFSSSHFISLWNLNLSWQNCHFNINLFSPHLNLIREQLKVRLGTHVLQSFHCQHRYFVALYTSKHRILQILIGISLCLRIRLIEAIQTNTKRSQFGWQSHRFCFHFSA